MKCAGISVLTWAGDAKISASRYRGGRGPSPPGIFLRSPRRAAVTSRWEVVLGYPVRTTGYFSAAQENMYAKTQVWFLHYNARPRSPGFAGSPLRHQPGHQRQPKSGGGVGQGRGRCGSWLTHPPCLCPPRGRAADAGLLLPNNRPAPDTRRRSPAAVLPSRPVISWFHGRGCEAGSGLGYLGRE